MKKVKLATATLLAGTAMAPIITNTITIDPWEQAAKEDAAKKDWNTESAKESKDSEDAHADVWEKVANEVNQTSESKTEDSKTESSKEVEKTTDSKKEETKTTDSKKAAVKVATKKEEVKKSAAILPQTNDTVNAGLVAGGVLSMLGSALLFFRKK